MQPHPKNVQTFLNCAIVLLPEFPPEDNFQYKPVIFFVGWAINNVAAVNRD